MGIKVSYAKSFSLNNGDSLEFPINFFTPQGELFSEWQQDLADNPEKLVQVRILIKSPAQLSSYDDHDSVYSSFQSYSVKEMDSLNFKLAPEDSAKLVPGKKANVLCIQISIPEKKISLEKYVELKVSQSLIKSLY